MGRISIVHPGAGAPDLLPIEVWQALTGAPVFAAPGDPLAARLREAGIAVGEIESATPAPTPGLAGRNLLAHSHGEVSPAAHAVAERLAELSRDGDVCYISQEHEQEQISRAVVGRALEDGLEVEFVIGSPPRGHRLLELVRVMARLRGPGGCPWDAEQTHQTLAKHLLDETYELLEVIESGTTEDIAEELGDLLLQVVFHAQMGEDASAFDIDEVSDGLVRKLVRRHPHVFGDVEVSGAREVVANWDEIKREEKARTSAVEGVPESLPALAFAQKLQRRAGAAGFDWRSVDEALAKVREEAEELVRATDGAQQEEELGDLLFSIVALARHLELDAETALRRAARTFRERLTHVEASAREKGIELNELSDDELLSSWQEAKTR
jgi:tetrapyrrole methylase family protein/MazG family protein